MKRTIIITLILFFAIGNSVLSEKTTVGLIKHEAGSLDDGYILFSPIYSNTTYLIDKCGYVINKWVSKYKPGFSAYLLPDGSLLRAGNIRNKQFIVGGSGGIIEKLDWNGHLLWSYKISNDSLCQHHDLKPLPNGNILTICWDKKNDITASEMGRKSTLLDSCLWSEKIIELHPIGKDSAERVWEWRVWDHLVQNTDSNKPNYADISKHPELINLNYSSNFFDSDWIHCNAIGFNEKYNQIIISAHNFDEVWIVDHTTTMKEASEHSGGKYGKGGDLLYRWGNSLAYGYGNVSDQRLYYQHSANWIPEGLPYENCIKVFNNERTNGKIRYSSIDIFKPPMDSNGFYDKTLPYGPAEPFWTYTAENPQEFYSSILGSAQQLPNGNVLICDGGAGGIFEIDSLKNEVWHYINPVTISGITSQGQSTMMENQLFKSTYYSSKYSAFLDKDLSRKGLIENSNSNSIDCNLISDVMETVPTKEIVIYPNPTDEQLTIETDYLRYTIEIFDIHNEKILMTKNTKTISTKTLSNGIYFILLKSENGDLKTNKFIVRR